MRSGQCSELCFLNFQELFVLPIQIFLWPKAGDFVCSGLCRRRWQRLLGIGEIRDQVPKCVALKHAGDIGKDHDLAVELRNGVVKNRQLAPVFRIIEQPQPGWVADRNQDPDNPSGRIG